ncbi:MAG: cation:proton antiporter [Halieaceae bacterium]
MSEYQVLTVLAAFAFFYSVVASRLERTPISGPVVYLFVGLACGSYGLGLVDLDIDREMLKRLAEYTLAMVLFADSANANMSMLKEVKKVPARLLLIGLPLTIAAGVVTGYFIFDSLTLLEIALLATMLAPTDAALGQAVVTNESVPDSVRESLNVESGLNDGICVPVLLIFLALATGQASGEDAGSLIVHLPLQAIGIGAGVGVVLALVGSSLVKFCGSRGWISGAWTRIPVITLAMFCFALSQWMGGSGFIGAFVGGMLFGALIKNHESKEELLAGAEGFGNLMSLLTWFVFGVVAFGKGLQDVSWQVILYAVLSLTVVRMLPVMLCLVGIKKHFDTQMFLGWFGPRGLASIVFIVMVLGENLPGANTLAAVVTWTVVLSIIAHGVSAVPFANKYAKRVAGRQGVV